MSSLLGGAEGAAGAGAMGAASQAAPAATGATGAAGTMGTYASGFMPANSAYGAGTYGVMANNAAPATYPIPQAPSNYVMQSSGAGPYQLPVATGGMYGEAPPTPIAETFMHKLMEYAKRNPSTAPDRSMPSGPQAGPPAPPQYSHLLGQSGQYPTLASLMAYQLPALQTRG